MKRKLYIPAVLGLTLAAALVLLAACKATDTAVGSRSDAEAAEQARAASQADGARRITAAELQKMLEDGEAVVYDTRPLVSYEEEHIKGSLSMPSSEVESHTGELPQGKTLVFYCTWPNEHTSAGAVLKLKSQGINNAAALYGGLAAWKGRGLPTEGSSKQ